MPDTASPTPPIKKSLTVPLAPGDAFDLFTSGIDRWWPKDSHSLAARDGAGNRTRVRVEAREGGRVIETLPDGREAAWATVAAWVPGERFAMQWYVGRDEAEATFVDVRFAAINGGTLVELAHSGFDVLGPAAGDICANYTSGWDLVLGCCLREAVAVAALT